MSNPEDWQTYLNKNPTEDKSTEAETSMNADIAGPSNSNASRSRKLAHSISSPRLSSTSIKNSSSLKRSFAGPCKSSAKLSRNSCLSDMKQSERSLVKLAPKSNSQSKSIGEQFSSLISAASSKLSFKGGSNDKSSQKVPQSRQDYSSTPMQGNVRDSIYYRGFPDHNSSVQFSVQSDSRRNVSKNKPHGTDVVYIYAPIPGSSRQKNSPRSLANIGDFNQESTTPMIQLSKNSVSSQLPVNLPIQYLNSVNHNDIR